MTAPEPRRRSIDVREVVTGVLALVVAVACVLIVIVNQQTVGWPHFFAMMAALLGLIVLLALYNRRYR
ncbi:hypothetical protein IFU40_01285 [Microbacterium sp. CFBP 13617]|uniref:DUF6903 family protein n=1 Tax=Microbacterium sp. CFBP 13617 TaxID=2774035 RepID=UPI0017834F5D|nr:hypothetical protein [Microbacterium sp. CFBP 13617]MBD8217261.1 hypothetical protein [Microbacterium sp. CFBP 13617]